MFDLYSIYRLSTDVGSWEMENSRGGFEIIERFLAVMRRVISVLRMSSEGLPHVDLVVNVALKDVNRFGFDLGSASGTLL